MTERYLTEIQVAERTGISLKTLRRWRLENRGPKYSKFGSLVRYGVEELVQWEQAQPCGRGRSHPANQGKTGETWHPDAQVGMTYGDLFSWDRCMAALTYLSLLLIIWV